jgi:hypothetical protein
LDGGSSVAEPEETLARVLDFTRGPRGFLAIDKNG